jgi:hypothetical protein
MKSLFWPVLLVAFIIVLCLVTVARFMSRQVHRRNAGDAEAAARVRIGVGDSSARGHDLGGVFPEALEWLGQIRH